MYYHLFVVQENGEMKNGHRSLSTAEVAAIIACPMFVICMFIMLIIWFYQRRKSQLPMYGGVHSEDDIDIPTGMSLHDALTDISTGKRHSVLSLLYSYFKKR